MVQYGAYAKGVGQYKEESVNAMSGVDLLTTVYNEAIKCINRAKVAKDAENYVMLEEQLDKANEIIKYLSATLDRQYEISAELDRLYEFMNFTLTKAKISRKLDEALDVANMLMELRDSFVQASKQSEISK